METVNLGDASHARFLASRYTALAALLSTILTATVSGGNMYNQAPMPGGVQSQATITSITPHGTNVTVCWHGLQSWYNVQGKTLSGTNWTTLGRTAASDYPWCLTVPTAPGASYVFRLSQENAYVGAGGCAGCHGDVYGTWVTTPHAGAYDSIGSVPNNQECLVCHTVGYGQPGGFVSASATPNLKGVGCENCHGPAAAHKYGDHSLIQPAVTVSSAVCGGCHDGPMDPTYTEWTNSAHAVVTPDVASGFNDTVSGRSRMLSCGSCHSGATRVAMLQNYAYTQAGYLTTSNAMVFPTGADAQRYGQTCAVCHDPHSTDGGPHQVRNPVSSTNFFSYSTSQAGATNAAGQFINWNFNTQYQTNIQICAQCHNARGALWTDTSRPPHHSLQYNMLLGDIGVIGTNLAPYQPSTHAQHFTNQCVDCHMQTSPFQGPSTPANTGHQFGVNTFTLCVPCHGPNASNLVDFAMNLFLPAQTAQVTAALNRWAATKALAALYAKYGNRAWEYTNPGTLSTPGAGPTTAEQAQIPANIKKARFNVYLANDDPASGIHNPFYVITLCNAALSFVQQELIQ